MTEVYRISNGGRLGVGPSTRQDAKAPTRQDAIAAAPARIKELEANGYRLDAKQRVDPMIVAGAHAEFVRGGRRPAAGHKFAPRNPFADPFTPHIPPTRLDTQVAPDGTQSETATVEETEASSDAQAQRWREQNQNRWRGGRHSIFGSGDDSSKKPAVPMHRTTPDETTHATSAFERAGSGAGNQGPSADDGDFGRGIESAVDARDATFQKQKDAWKNPPVAAGRRIRGDGGGSVNGPQPTSASRVTREQTTRGRSAFGGVGNEGDNSGSFAVGPMDVGDDTSDATRKAQDACLAKQKNAWMQSSTRVPNDRR